MLSAAALTSVALSRISSTFTRQLDRGHFLSVSFVSAAGCGQHRRTFTSTSTLRTAVYRKYNSKSSDLQSASVSVMVNEVVVPFPIQTQLQPKKHDTFIGYGTAGFRTKAHLLDHVMYRVGIVAALRSMAKNGARIGLMITASHNPEVDNGVKLIDPKGEMLEVRWEKYATDLANCPDEEVAALVKSVITTESIDTSITSAMCIGRDTRESSPRLLNALLDFVRQAKVEYVDYGVVSTPVVHYMVICSNYPEEYGEATPENYYKTLSSAFRNIITMHPNAGSYKPELTVDGSNGVGALAMKTMTDYLEKDILNVDIVNDGSTGILNSKCGADFVKVNQRGPENLKIEAGRRYVAFDGDADRIIYFYYDSSLKFRMLDGDKIAVLFAQHLGDLVKRAGFTDLKLGIVQSAYANGSSTNYIQDVLGIPVTFTPTGVKYLHHEALNYDIGVYFEANGHGTVVFSAKAKSVIRAQAAKCVNATTEGHRALIELSNFLNLINSCVGDAMSDMLAVEAMLHSKGWSIEDWDAVYTDLPNKLLTVKVVDRNVIQTTDAERTVVSPKGVQESINALVAKYKNGRSFVRPSGTEDIVRVYAEADTKANADLLGAEVSVAVYELCNGAGEKPTLPSSS